MYSPYAPQLSRTMLAAFFGALMLSTGCATLKVQPERVTQVKSVAVIGYTAVWDANNNRSRSKVEGISGAIKAISKNANGEAEAEREERALATYDLLVETLQKDMGWSVIDRTALSQNQPFQEVVSARGAHPGGGMFSPYSRYLFVEGVLRKEHADSMSSAERAQLMEALNVDALAQILIRFSVVESGFAIGGIGNRRRHPIATVEFIVYDRSSEEPIWKERFARGERAEQMMSQNIAGVTVDREVIAAVVEAAANGYQAMIQRYRSYQP